MRLDVTHLFDLDSLVQLLTTMKTVAKSYRTRLSAAQSLPEVAALHAEWQRDAAEFSRIADLMTQQARTPEQQNCVLEVQEHFTHQEFGAVGKILEARSTIATRVANAANQALRAAPSDRPTPAPLKSAPALRVKFWMSAYVNWHGIQAVVDYVALVATGKLPTEELHAGARELAKVLANDYAGGQSPIEPHCLLVYANRLLGLTERDLKRDNADQAMIWEEEALAGLLVVAAPKARTAAGKPTPSTAHPKVTHRHGRRGGGQASRRT